MRSPNDTIQHLKRVVGLPGEQVQLTRGDLFIEEMDGKAMVVCMSRRICVDLYRELVKLRPDWHHDDDTQGQIKVVMTGSATDPQELATTHQEQEPEGCPGQPFPGPQ